MKQGRYFVFSLVLFLLIGVVYFICNFNSVKAFNPGDLIINEFNLTPDNSWLEILNTTDNDIDLSDWNIIAIALSNDYELDVNYIPTTTILSGVVPAKGLLLIEKSILWPGDQSTSIPSLIQLTYNSLPISAVSFGFHYDTYPYVDKPNADQSAVYQIDTWSVTDTMTPGWFNQTVDILDCDNPPALNTNFTPPSLHAIASCLPVGVFSNINNNLEIANPTQATGLYFSKADKGKITFNNAINLTDQYNLDLLMQLNDKLLIDQGKISLHTGLADKIKNLGADLIFYDLLTAGYDDVDIESVVVSDDNNQLIAPDSDQYPDFSALEWSDENGGRLQFSISHFSGYEILPHLLEVMPISSSTANSVLTYIFNSSAEGNYSLLGSCSSVATGTVVKGDNVLTFQLPAGEYNDCILQVQDFKGGISQLDISSFTISESNAPEVFTWEAEVINASTVNLKGEIIVDEGLLYERGFYYGLSSPYENLILDNATGTLSTGVYNLSLSGLVGGQLYQFASYVSSSHGVATGSVKQFITRFEPTSVNPTSIIQTDYTSTSTIRVNETVTNAVLDLSLLLTSSSAKIPGQINVDSFTSMGKIQMSMASNTEISGADWSGVIILPSLRITGSVVVTPDPGYNASVDRVVEVGSELTDLSFDRGVRLLIPGRAGYYLGYYQNSVFKKITTVCSADSQSVGDALSAGAECYISVNGDLVIWTKHFTSFVTYSQSLIVIPDLGGGDGGGLAGGADGGSVDVVVPPPVLKPPQDAYILINNDVSNTATTTVALKLNAVGATKMMISNYSNFADADWENYATAKYWRLTPELGKKSVWAKFKNDVGQTAATYDVIDLVRVGEGPEEVPFLNPLSLTSESALMINGCPVISAGNMIKVVGKPAIYAVNNKMEVMYFPSGDEFKSWRPSYGGYISISQSCFDSLAVPSVYPAAVNYRAGSYIVKRPSSDQLYVVLPNNTLAKISSSTAKILYGKSAFEGGIEDKPMVVSDVFWPHYINRSADINEAKVHEGMLVKINNKIYYIDVDNKMREVTTNGFVANGFQEKFVRQVPTSAISHLTNGVLIDMEISAISDKVQGAGRD